VRVVRHTRWGARAYDALQRSVRAECRGITYGSATNELLLRIDRRYSQMVSDVTEALLELERA
jgi:hypothetical protein